MKENGSRDDRVWGNIRRKIATPRNVGFDGRGPTRERIERGRRVERVESGTRQTCLAITEKLKRSRQPPLFPCCRGFFWDNAPQRLFHRFSFCAIPLVSFGKHSFAAFTLKKFSSAQMLFHTNAIRHCLHARLRCKFYFFFSSVLGKK